MKYTIEDVAREAGVSISTVSRVMNNNYPVKKETRQRIEEAIKKLNYKPNALARGLVSGKSNIIGVLVPNLKSLIYTEMISSIEEQLSQNGYDVMIYVTNSDKGEEEAAINRFINRSVDGIVIIETSLSTEDEFLKSIIEKTSIIFINAHNEENNNVYVDNKEALENVIEYLLNFGHTKVAIVGEAENKVHDEHIKHYKECLIKHEMYSIALKVEAKDLDNENIDILKNLVNEGYVLGRDITSIIVCDDLVMMRVIRALSERNIKIPDDVSMINLKNTTLSKYLKPSISTIDISPDKIAQIASEKIIHLIKNKEYEVSGEKLEAEIIERESCRNLIRKVKGKLEEYYL